MNNYNLEAFKKSFLLFFIVQVVFLSLIIYKTYNDKIEELNINISSSLMQCYLQDNCVKYNSINIELTDKLQHHLYKENNSVFMIFKSNNKFKKVIFSPEDYEDEENLILKDILLYMLLYVFILILISFLFAVYTTNPLKRALMLNDEFIKDILHDINTPLAALKINLKILAKEFGNNGAISRSQDSINNILSLQENMNYFLNQSTLNKDKVNLTILIKAKINFYENLFQDIDFNLQIDNEAYLLVNDNAINRILDNIISNAAKYNKKNGHVLIQYENKILSIKDDGKGIKNTKKIFDRYYKENHTGIGIGLHVVKKLCENSNIQITVHSIINKGTTFQLNLSEVIFK